MNAAQQILEALGAGAVADEKRAHGNKNASATKAGPGRYHADGLKESRPPVQRGAGYGFQAHHATQAKKDRRALVKSVGRRQAIKLGKIERALARDWLRVPDDIEAPAEA